MGVELVHAHFNGGWYQGQRPGEQRIERRELVFKKGIHQDTVKPDSRGRVSRKIKRGCEKTCHDMAGDDEADAEQAIEERRGRAGGH